MLWLADFTYIRIAVGFCYLVVILDACGRKIVGYGLSKRLDTPLAWQHCGQHSRTESPAVFTTRTEDAIRERDLPTSAR
ncbi:hypothetical protein [Neorhizobium alkalisoli]|jgi:hypothetical protein|uniref:hypothetical protein n=1 Tax=Neorhizobium alkalisoli TaxID=528178 RepID=UPI003D7C2D67